MHLQGLQSHERYFFLFDDTLIIGKPTGRQRYVHIVVCVTELGGGGGSLGVRVVLQPPDQFLKCIFPLCARAHVYVCVCVRVCVCVFVKLSVRRCHCLVLQLLYFTLCYKFPGLPDCMVILTLSKCVLWLQQHTCNASPTSNLAPSPNFLFKMILYPTYHLSGTSLYKIFQRSQVTQDNRYWDNKDDSHAAHILAMPQTKLLYTK